MGESPEKKLSLFKTTQAAKRLFTPLPEPKRKTVMNLDHLPTCQGPCRDKVIVGKDGLIEGKYCSACARELGVLPPLPPAA